MEATRLVEPVSWLSLRAHAARQLDAVAAGISRPLNSTLHQRRADSAGPRLSPNHHRRDARYWPRLRDRQLTPNGQQSYQSSPDDRDKHRFIASGQPLGCFGRGDWVPQLLEQLPDLLGIAQLGFTDDRCRVHLRNVPRP